MPLFPDKKLLFIHIPKNAGRSVEQALLEGGGSHDGGRRRLSNRIFHALQRATRSRFAEDHLIGTIDATFAGQHLTFREMQMLGLLPDDAATAWTMFCICRNPFDRAVSSIRHFHETELQDATQFERLLAHWLDRAPADHNLRAHRRTQSDFVRDDKGNCGVGTILRYETLAEDFSWLMARIGRPDIALGWSGKSDRSRDYRAYYTPSARKMVETVYAEDLERFGYGF